jgi:hypothetical protein
VDCVRGVIEGFVRQQQQVAAVVAHVPHEDDPVVEDGTIDLAEWQPPPFSVDANVRLSVPIMRTTPLSTGGFSFRVTHHTLTVDDTQEVRREASAMAMERAQ